MYNEILLSKTRIAKFKDSEEAALTNDLTNENINELSERVREYAEETKRETVLTATNITLYDGDRTVLDRVNLTVKKKGVHGILAPHGSGKTALADVLSCSMAFDKGRLCIFGEEHLATKDYAVSVAELKKKIGYVRQDDAFYTDMTVQETLAFVGEAKKVESGKLYRQIKEALELTELEGVKKRLVKKLSAIERKRLSFAAALIGNPSVIIIDGLNPAELSVGYKGTEFYGLVQMLGKMKTVILATSDCGVIKELCEDVAILSDGRLLASGRVDEIEQRLSRENETLEGLYRSLVKASEKAE